MTTTAKIFDAHDVAARTDRALLRAWRVLHSIREDLDGEVREQIRVRIISSGLLDGLQQEIDRWL